MFKRDEIKILKDAVAKLGSDSYCGDWLKATVAEVERDIANDLEPVYSIEAQRRYCKDIEETARQQAESIRKQAEEDAAKIIASAEQKARRARESILSEIHRAQLLFN